MLRSKDVANSLDFVDLKNRIKNEVKRRVHYGNISHLGGSEYDFKTTPKEGTVLEADHYNKIADVARAIDSTNIEGAKSHGDTLKEMVILDTEITRFESQTVTSSSNDCNSNCTGMCVSQCSSTCTGGCTGSCRGSCKGSCSGCSGCSGCGVTCSYNCSGGCMTDCTLGCDSYCAGCGSHCALSCGGSCSTTCSDGCTNSCAQVAKS